MLQKILLGKLILEERMQIITLPPSPRIAVKLLVLLVLIFNQL